MVGLEPLRGTGWRWRALAGGAVIVALLVVLFDSTYERIFSHINIVDDEGYAINTLRSFAAGNALYDEVFSQYGPGFYTLVGGAMDLFAVPFTSESARWINLFMWLASTGLAGVALLRLTASPAIAGVGALITYLVLSADAFEPLHPGATIGFLLLAMVAAVALLIPARYPAAMAVLGALCVAMASVKVNVGGLAGISVLFACALTSPWLRPIALVRWAAVAAVVAVPFVLMRDGLQEEDTLRWALILAAGGIGIALMASWQGAGTRPERRDLALMAGAGIGVLALVALVPIVLGTSPGGLIDGWLVRPAEHPTITFVTIVLDPFGLPWAMLGLIAAAAVSIWLPGRPADSRIWLGLGAARMAAGVAIWLCFASPVFGLSPDLSRATLIASPLVWLAAIGHPGESPALRFVRVLLPALALLQTLHAYPVPGAQFAWSEVLFVIVAGVMIRDGAEDLRPFLRPQREQPRRTAVAATVAVAGFGVWFAAERVKPFTDAADASYAASEPLGLEGTGPMRAKPDLVAQLRGLAAGIERNCDSLITLPGMNSLNLYTGVGSPEELASPWMLFLTADEQQAIVDKARTETRLCAVAKPDLLEFWSLFTYGDGIPDRPLVRFIQDDFELIHNYQGYYLEKRR